MGFCFNKEQKIVLIIFTFHNLGGRLRYNRYDTL